MTSRFSDEIFGPDETTSRSSLTRMHEAQKRAWLIEQIMERVSLRTLKDSSEILYYKDGIYRHGGEKEILILLQELGRYEIKNSMRKEVLETIRAKTFTDRNEFDSDLDWIVCKNKIVNLRTGEVKEHDPEHLSLIQIPATYHPTATCPRFISFLYNTLVDPKDVPLVLEYLAYCLIKNSFMQKNWLIPGPPASGKSTLLMAGGRFLGESNLSHKMLSQLTTNRFATASLYGKLANIFADISDKRLVELETFKALSTGDPIDAEKKGKDSFTFIPHAKLIFSTNKPPKPTEEMDDSYYRRWIMTPSCLRKYDYFTKKPVAKDPDILDKITTEEELSGLLNLVLISAMRILQKRKFCRNPSVDEIRDAYQRLNDPVKAWMDDNCVISPDYFGNKDELHADYVSYCFERKFPVVELIGLGRELVKYGINDTKAGHGREHVWRGIDLRKNRQQQTLPLS